MNRRDVITIFLFVLWGLFVIFVIPTFVVSSKMLIAIFGFSMLVVLVLYITLIILSLAIKRFGKWGDKKVFNF